MVENLVVSNEVYEHVRYYFKEHKEVSKYIPLYICQKYSGDFVYRVLAYNPIDQGYYVWTCWNESTQSLNGGNYGGGFGYNINSAMKIFLNVEEIIEEPCVINSVRMKEIAEVTIDKIVNYDPDLAKEIIIDDLDMTDNELEYFEIRKSQLEPYEDIED